MKLNNKKAVSDVVTTVLLILLAIAAVVIVWVVIQNFVREGSKEVTGSADCLSTRYDVTSVTTNGNVTLRRTSGNVDIGVIRASIGTSSATVQNPNIKIAESTTTGQMQPPITLQSGQFVDVYVAFELSDGTSCRIQEAQSVAVS
ncbi:MAG: archaellin/type IV pilin N-terminal domain-containing protein [Candidatus Pacearchaeota archaeon]